MMKRFIPLLLAFSGLALYGCDSSNSSDSSDNKATSETTPFVTTQLETFQQTTQEAETEIFWEDEPVLVDENDDEIFGPEDIIIGLDDEDETQLEPEVVVRPDFEATENGITTAASSLLGIGFTQGGSSPSEGFDNSGFIYYVLNQNGFLNAPRRISEQAQMGDRVSEFDELQPGDLVFFSESGAAAEYGGIYMGNNTMIFSSSLNEVVREQDISGDYWKNAFFNGIRVL
ncbi:MAG: C40 family peptidase [Oscillospiraceae bacterium]|nr:C40 family peptidase [Oscillospiraceae bacterium]